MPRSDSERAHRLSEFQRGWCFGVLSVAFALLVASLFACSREPDRTALCAARFAAKCETHSCIHAV